MKKAYYLCIVLLMCACSPKEVIFVNAEVLQEDTLFVYSLSQSRGKFDRIMWHNGRANKYSGNYWIDGHNMWVEPWHGIAYDGSDFYVTDSASINLIIRKNLLGKINILEQDDHNIFVRIN